MSRQATLLALLGAALLLVVLVIVYRFRPAEPDPPLREAAGVERDSSPARIEAAPSETRSAPASEAAALVTAVTPPEDLRAEGARRGWQLPFGKGWWTDTLVNPTGIDPEGAALEVLQERARSWGDQLLALKSSRKERLDAHCNERIAAGLAVQNPKADAVLPEGKLHVMVTTHTLQAPNTFWRVDVGPGDDAELDEFDRQTANTWCDAVADLRRRFAALQR